MVYRAERGRVARGNNDHKTHDLLSSESARGLPFPATLECHRAAGKQVVQFANKFLFFLVIPKFSVQTGQAMISSRR